MALRPSNTHAAVKIAREAAPGTEFTFIAADANLPVEAQDAATGAKKFLGNINVLVNSTVAVYQPKLLHETSIDDIPRMLFEQGAGPLVTTRAVIPFLREQGTGSVLSVASDAAKVPTPGETVIGASMAAIVSFTTRQAHLGMTYPQDVAHLVVFLSSLEASVLTGQVISVNGGISVA